MYTYRMSFIGALILLGACSIAPQYLHAATTAAASNTAALAVAPSVVPTSQALPPAAAPVAPQPKKATTVPAVATAAGALQVSGSVELTASRGQEIEAGEQADTLVYFVPDKGGSRAKPGHYTVYTDHRDFSPEAMAVPLGSTVTFVNLDEVRHNVFSVTPGSSFDLGYQGAGEKAAQVFGRAGIVLVSCNVHHSMELDVLVVPSAYMVKVGADGKFSLGGLPAGPGTLHFWNPRAQPISQKLTLPVNTPVSQRIVVTRPRLTTAINAAGKP